MTNPAPDNSIAAGDKQAAVVAGPETGMPRGLVVLLGAAAAVVVGAGVQQLAWLIGPGFLALVIVITVAPVQQRLRDRGWPKWAVTLALVVAVYGVVLVLATAVLVSIARLATAVPQYAAGSESFVTSGASLLSRFGVGPDELRKVVDALDVGKLAQALSALLSDVAGLATSFVFVLVLLLFLSVETSSVDARIAVISVDRPAAAQAMRRFARGTRQYLLVSTVFGLIVAALDTVALAVMGIPLAVTWGVLAFVTNYIPNIGFVIGLIPPALLGLLVGGPRTMLLVIVVYCVLNFVVQSLIQPRFVGDAVGLSVTVTFLSLVFWTWLIGPLGAILAIPLTLLVKALLVDIDPRARWADALLRSTSARTDGAGPESTSEPVVARRPWWRRQHAEKPSTA